MIPGTKTAQLSSAGNWDSPLLVFIHYILTSITPIFMTPPPSVHVGASMKSFGGNDKLSILFDDMKCNGSESNLLQCRRNLGKSDCTHLEDVGVACTATGQ